MSNLNSQQRLRGHCLGSQKRGPRGNPHTTVALYVAPNHLETLPTTGVSVHMASRRLDWPYGRKRLIPGTLETLAGLLGSPKLPTREIIGR